MRSSTPLSSLLMLVLPALLVGGILVYAGNIADCVRLACLSLFGCVLTYLSLIRHSRMLLVISIAWWLIFLSDASLRASTWLLFNSDTDAYFIVQAIANTTAHETVEFVQSHIVSLIIFLVIISLCLVSYFYMIKRCLDPNKLTLIWQQRLTRSLVIVLALGMIGSYAMRPARALFPAIYWTSYYGKISDFKDSISQHKQLQAQWAKTAREHITYDNDFHQKQTHVLAISESVTSLNFGICGYPRETTPQIKKRLHEIQVFCNAYSPYSSTINAVKAKLTDSQVTQPNNQPHESILSYAKAAGFKVYWISNQDDSYISSLFGADADTALYLNKRSGRSSSHLDESILPAYLKALADPNPRKLIILHLIGAHPNYENRYPTRFNHFTAQSNDQVEQLLDRKNIGLWVQAKRNEYDNAILYQDWLFSQLLDTIQANTQQGFRSFTFISDHGNEVGHELDYAGHSPTTKAGYQVPVIMWHDQIHHTGVDLNKLIDTSELDQNLMHLMGLRDKTDPPQSYWLDQNYQFKPSTAWPYWQKKLAPI